MAVLDALAGLDVDEEGVLAGGAAQVLQDLGVVDAPGHHGPLRTGVHHHGRAAGAMRQLDVGGRVLDQQIGQVILQQALHAGAQPHRHRDPGQHHRRWAGEHRLGDPSVDQLVQQVVGRQLHLVGDLSAGAGQLRVARVLQLPGGRQTQQQRDHCSHVQTPSAHTPACTWVSRGSSTAAVSRASPGRRLPLSR